MKKILTIILDGFGMREEEVGNAIKAAKMPNFEKLWKEYPHSLLEASEEYVGLNKGQFGNSEVGHMTIGAGRLVKQNEILVNEFLEKEYLENEIFNELLKEQEKHIHIMGLCSAGNVHSGIDDFLKLFEILYENKFKNIHFHLITDGRDTSVKASLKYISMIEEKIKEYKIGDITSICGRYYAMDRDENYERTKQYYDLIVKGIGISSTNLKISLQNFYDKNITDEFIKPVIINSENKIKDNDIIIWMNYRADRSKQILSALLMDNFNKFSTKIMPNLKIYSFFPIDKKIKTINFLESPDVENPLGLYLSFLDLTQARIAESEKFPHVTYFFDGGYAGKIEKCDKFEILSPDVATYDLQPEMSAVPVTQKVCKAMEHDYDFILLNFANPDMVGHTGNFEAAIKACMAVDVCLGKILEIAEDNFYKVIILADHGNVDIMYDENKNICTTHTTSPVPFIIKDKKIILKEKGDLTMVAPTILTYMDIALPKEMQNTELLFAEE